MLNLAKVIGFSWILFGLSGIAGAEQVCEIKSHTVFKKNMGRWYKMDDHKYYSFKQCDGAANALILRENERIASGLVEPIFATQYECRSGCERYATPKVQIPPKCQDGKYANVVLNWVKNRHPEFNATPIDGSNEFSGSQRTANMITGEQCNVELKNCEFKAAIMKRKSVAVNDEPYNLFFSVSCSIQ